MDRDLKIGVLKIIYDEKLGYHTLALEWKPLAGEKIFASGNEDLQEQINDLMDDLTDILDEVYKRENFNKEVSEAEDIISRGI